MKRIMINDDEVRAIVNNLEQQKLKVSSHLYKRFPERMIGGASYIFSNEYTNEAKERPGLVLLSVILAAHRNYTKQVEPQIDRIRTMDFYSIQDLKQKTKSFNDFTDFCGMRDLDKYEIIIKLINVIDDLKRYNGIINDYDVLKKWALQADYINFKKDIIGRIKGIGIATFQHLRMNFGADTVKPDQRVKEVLNKEFGFYSDKDIEYIFAVEYIAKIIGKRALYVDQVFVNYGSGYYIKEENKEKKIKDKSIELKHESSNTLIHKPYNGLNKVEHMLKYIENIITDLDVFVEKRNDGGYIAVASKLKHLSKGKNVFTYWKNSSSVTLIILQVLPRKTYYSVEEMKQDEIAIKAKLKYSKMVNG